MDIYREAILDHYKHPRNFGHLRSPDVAVQERNATCGDRIVMEIKIKGKGLKLNVIDDIRFSGEGCAISQASASMLTEFVKGMDMVKIRKLSRHDIEHMLGVFLTPSRVKCATLPLEVLQKAVVSLEDNGR